MKSIDKQTNSKAAFTIIELLTVMSIIVILIGLLVPSLNMARRFAKKLTQMNQLKVIGVSIEFFNSDFDGYPPSDAVDGMGQPYCGALKLCEAMVGQDLMGFHPDSVFRADGRDSTDKPLYIPLTRKTRKNTYLSLEKADIFKLRDIYDTGQTGNFNFNQEAYVLCDVYTRQMRTGEKTGMPLLYYKADTSNDLHDPNNLPTIGDNNGNIYNYTDNQAMLAFGKPWQSTGTTTGNTHSLSGPVRFYKNTRNHKITFPARPFRENSFILISAGFDGEYGTADDICNFELKYKQ